MDRGGNSSMEYDDQNKAKQQNTSTSNSGILGITSKLVGTGVDVSGATTSGASNVTDVSATSGLVDSNISANSDLNHTNKNNTATATGGQQFSNNEVDEDGYSIQPPKEVAWDENKENGNCLMSQIFFFNFNAQFKICPF